LVVDETSFFNFFFLKILKVFDCFHFLPNFPLHHTIMEGFVSNWPSRLCPKPAAPDAIMRCDVGGGGGGVGTLIGDESSADIDKNDETA
jgi:hypothetical protein